MFEPTTLLLVGAAVLGYLWWKGDKPILEKKETRQSKTNLLEVKKLLEEFGVDEVGDVFGNLALGEVQAAEGEAETLNKNLKSDDFKKIMLRRIATRVLARLLNDSDHKQFVYDMVDKARKMEQ